MILSFRAATRIGFLFFVIYIFASIVSFSRHQASFQKELDAKYITWDDFPPVYAEALRTEKDEFFRETFDHKAAFPPPANASATIPPIIHFIWFKNLYATRPEVTNIPSLGSNAPTTCATYNPDFDVKTWDAEAARALLEEHYAWFLPTYDAYRYPIQRVDALKYFLLWHYGGIYMDMDIECRRPMDPLLPFPAWFPEASPLGVNNDLMATRAKHPVVKLMLQSLGPRNRNLIFPYLTIFWSTGPQFTSDLLKKWHLMYPSTFVKGSSKKHPNPDEWFVLPQVFYSEAHTFFGHTAGGTWHGDDVAVVLWFVAHPFIFWTLVLTVLAGLTVFGLRLRKRRTKVENDWEA